MRALFLFVVLLKIGFAAPAQDSTLSLTDGTKSFTEPGRSPTVADSSAIQLRSFELNKVEQLKGSGDFDYKQPPTIAESLWNRFLVWIGQLIELLFRGAVQTDWGMILLYTLGLAVLIIIIMMVLKVDALRVFFSGADTGPLNYNAIRENIHEMDFENLIREMRMKKEYRHGVRLTFLYALKLLSDKQYVDWRPGKTNHDYLEELGNQDLKTGFNELSFYFDYTWYGEFAVNENLYQRVQTIFEDWKKHVS